MRAFVIAMECEARAIEAALKPDDRLYVCGIGKVNAAMAAQRAIDEGADEIVNAGLAGAIDPAMSVGEVYEIAGAVEYDFDLDELNHRGVGTLEECEGPVLPMSCRDRGKAKLLASGDHFRNDDADFSLIRSLGCSIRDMEGAAIAHVCLKNGVFCRSFKAISNVAGAGGMVDQYEKSKALALAALASAVVDPGRNLV